MKGAIVPLPRPHLPQVAVKFGDGATPEPSWVIYDPSPYAAVPEVRPVLCLDEYHWSVPLLPSPCPTPPVDGN